MTTGATLDSQLRRLEKMSAPDDRSTVKNRQFVAGDAKQPQVKQRTIDG